MKLHGYKGLRRDAIILAVLIGLLILGKLGLWSLFTG